jgi:hypothetical protein
LSLLIILILAGVGLRLFDDNARVELTLTDSTSRTDTRVASDWSTRASEATSSPEARSSSVSRR